jgi:hypothetical protein
VPHVRTLPPPGIEALVCDDGLEVRRYQTGRADGSEALAVLRDGELERVVDLHRLPIVESSGHPYRGGGEGERVVVAPEGQPGPVLAELVSQGWRVIGRQGEGWVLER